jgi:hypothetical protein
MFIYQLPVSSSISAFIEDDGPITPRVPRGKRSDLTEKDLEEFRASFGSVHATNIY